MAITGILENYGFETRKNHTQWWGCGSLVWGHIAEVKSLGSDRYEVKHHVWQYNCNGDPVVDKEETEILYGAKALQYLFERLPLFRR